MIKMPLTGRSTSSLLPHSQYNHLMSDETPSTEVSVLASSTAGIVEALSAAVNLSSGGIYHEPSCPFCTSRRRSDAEDLWLNKDIMAKDPESRIVSFFQSHGETVSPDAVDNHVKNHMRRGGAEIRKMEYISKIANLSQVEITTPMHLKMAMSVVMDCLTSSAEVSPSKRMSPAKAWELKTKNVNALVKTWSDLLSLKCKLEGEMEDKGEILSFPKAGFRKVFSDALTQAVTKEDKELIHSILKNVTSLVQQ